MSDGLPARQIIDMIEEWADTPHPTEESWWPEVPEADRVRLIEQWEQSAGGTARRVADSVREVFGSITEGMTGAEVLHLMRTARLPEDPTTN